MKNKLDNFVSAYEGATPYEFDNEVLLNWYPKRIIELSGNINSVLELGVGHGYTTQIFSKSFARHKVLEGSQAVIDNFQARFPECKTEIQQTYFEHFDTEEKFDAIIMGFILEHVDDPSLILRHYKKYLKPGGKIYAAVPNATAMNRQLGHLSGMLDDIETLSDYDKELGHKRYYDIKSFTKEIEDAGLQIKTIEGLYLKPFTTSQIMSLSLPQKVIESLCLLGIEYPELSLGILAEIEYK